MTGEVLTGVPQKLTLLDRAHARRIKISSFIHPFSWPEVRFTENTSPEQQARVEVNRRLAYQYLIGGGELGRFEAKRSVITIDASQLEVPSPPIAQPEVIAEPSVILSTLKRWRNNAIARYENYFDRRQKRWNEAKDKKKNDIHEVQRRKLRESFRENRGLHGFGAGLKKTLKDWFTSPERGDVAPRHGEYYSPPAEKTNDVLETRTVRRRWIPPMMLFGPKKNKIDFNLIGNPTQEQFNQKMDRAFVNLGYNLFNIKIARWATLSTLTTGTVIGAKVLLSPIVNPLLASIGAMVSPWGPVAVLALGGLYLAKKFLPNMIIGRLYGETTDRLRGKFVHLEKRYKPYEKFIAAQPNRPFTIK